MAKKQRRTRKQKATTRRLVKINAKAKKIKKENPTLCWRTCMKRAAKAV